jgi:hypothetical protein
LKVLEYTSTIKQSNIFNLNKKYIKKFNTIPQSSGVSSIIHPNTSFINESGLYEVLSKSSKPLAKIFIDKYFKEIMPEIRKTGKYISNKNDMNEIKKLNSKINNYKTELNYYDNYKFEPSEYGYLYINENNQTKDGKSIKCYKIGYDKDMEKRIRQYKVGNFKYKLLAYIPLQLDRKQIEKCVKTRLKPHLTKLIIDSVCYISLKELKKEIIDCINFTNQHICHCIKCSKMYKLNSIDKHKCNIQKVTDIIDYKISKKLSKRVSKKSSKKVSKKTS